MSHGITATEPDVREMPWHGLGVVLDEYPKSIDDALEKAGPRLEGLATATCSSSSDPSGPTTSAPSIRPS